MRRLAILFFLLFVWHEAALCAGGRNAAASDAKTRTGAGAGMTLPPVEVRSVVRGAYEVRRAGAQVGREDFVTTTMSNDTVIHESVYQVMEGGGAAVSGNNRLEVEEESGFPRSYYTYRRTEGTGGETVREVSIRMFANVAAVSERNGDVETTSRIVLPTGCLFVEGNIAHHIRLVLDRYDRTSGGRQKFSAFDPLGLGTTDVALEFAGQAPVPDSSAAGGEKPAEKMDHYKYYTGGAFAADVFVAADGAVARIDAAPAQLEFVLVSRENRQ
jgi:hypothetical protein